MKHTIEQLLQRKNGIWRIVVIDEVEHIERRCSKCLHWKDIDKDYYCGGRGYRICKKCHAAKMLAKWYKNKSIGETNGTE
jgi:hypothetical protein